MRTVLDPIKIRTSDTVADAAEEEKTRLWASLALLFKPAADDSRGGFFICAEESVSTCSDFCAPRVSPKAY